MNGYELHANSYREYLEKNPDLPQENREHIESKIKTLDIMASLSEQERMMLFDTGAYNDVLKGYCRKAMQNCDIDHEKIQQVIGEIGYLLDTITASNI